jgi:hypothetical protein
MSHGKAWTPAEDALIRAEYATADLRVLCERMGRSDAAIQARAQMLRVRRRGRAWTRSEDAQIIERYATCSIKRLAHEMHRGQYAVATRAAELGVERLVGPRPRPVPTRPTIEQQRIVIAPAHLPAPDVVPQALAVRTPLEQCWRGA